MRGDSSVWNELGGSDSEKSNPGLQKTSMFKHSRVKFTIDTVLAMVLGQ